MKENMKENMEDSIIKINKEARTIRLRASFIGSTTRCMLKPQLLIKYPCESQENYKLKLGTLVHQIIQQKLISPETINIDSLINNENPKLGGDALNLLMNPKTIYEPSMGNWSGPLLYNINKDMFIIPLEVFEQKYEFKEIYKGWNFYIKGTLDSASKDGKLINDWKTSGSTPSKYQDYKSIPYFFQQCIYKALYNKHNNICFEPSYFILSYIVKNKTPKFVPKLYAISESMIEGALKHLHRLFDVIVHYLETDEFTVPSFNEYCGFCEVQAYCNTISQMVPKELPLDRLEII